MKYLLLIRINESEPGPAVLMPAYDQFTEELQQGGSLISASRLSGPAGASTVRVRAGRPSVTDGPYAETKEWLCGFYVVDCRDNAEAQAIAAKIPSSPYGTIEVVPFFEG